MKNTKQITSQLDYLQSDLDNTNKRVGYCLDALDQAVFDLEYYAAQENGARAQRALRLIKKLLNKAPAN